MQPREHGTSPSCVPSTTAPPRAHCRQVGRDWRDGSGETRQRRAGSGVSGVFPRCRSDAVRRGGVRVRRDFILSGASPGELVPCYLESAEWDTTTHGLPHGHNYCRAGHPLKWTQKTLVSGSGYRLGVSCELGLARCGGRAGADTRRGPAHGVVACRLQRPATARAVAVVLVAWNRVAPYKYTEKRGV